MARRLAAITVAIGVLAASVVAAVATTTESFYAAVENRLSAAGGMELACRALGAGFDVATVLSVVPRGRVPRGGRRVAELIAVPGGVAWVLCSWSYEGNYLANLQLFDTQWPEAKLCQDPSAAAGMCRLVFEDDMVSIETPDGGRRVLGDLPVKRCRRHWLLFSTECSYPDHPYPYAGRRLGNAFEYFAV
ncbi:hypothetical protein ABZP36_033891 [Zizania latifolia]